MIVKLKLCESSFQALVDLKLEEVMQTMKLWTHFLSVSELDAVQSLVEKGAETAAAAILILICVSETTDINNTFQIFSFAPTPTRPFYISSVESTTARTNLDTCYSAGTFIIL